MRELEKQTDNLIEFAKEQCEIFPEDSAMGRYLRGTLKMLQVNPAEEVEMEKHTDRQIYDGCIYLMQKMVDYFREYLERLGYDLDKLDEDERFAVEVFNMEIVRWLFLINTRNSGGCSVREFCGRIGIDPYDSVKFEFDWYE